MGPAFWVSQSLETTRRHVFHLRLTQQSLLHWPTSTCPDHPRAPRPRALRFYTRHTPSLPHPQARTPSAPLAPLSWLALALSHVACVMSSGPPRPSLQRRSTEPHTLTAAWTHSAVTDTSPRLTPHMPVREPQGAKSSGLLQGRWHPGTSQICPCQRAWLPQAHSTRSVEDYTATLRAASAKRPGDLPAAHCPGQGPAEASGDRSTHPRMCAETSATAALLHSLPVSSWGGHKTA